MNDVDPDELAVMEWMKLRLAHHHARHGVRVMSVHATLYPHSGEIGVGWALHMDDECVVGERTIAEGLRALKEKLAERAATEARV